jgi:ankyrin repeat protein
MNRYNYPPKKINNFIPDIPINEDSRDKLFSLATSHNIGELQNFVTTNSISLNVKNNNNQTIIHVLLDTESTTDEKELLRCIKFLVERGASITSSDKFLLTPLFICIKKNYPEIFKYLYPLGYKLDYKDSINLVFSV